MARDISKILSDVSMGDVSGLNGTGMPGVARTTTTAKEFAKKKRVWKTKFFPINNDSDASDYSEFMNWVLENGKERIVVREDSSWTKDGELIRVVDFIHYKDDPVNLDPDRDSTQNEPEPEPDITRVPIKDGENLNTGKRFSPEDYVSE